MNQLRPLNIYIFFLLFLIIPPAYSQTINAELNTLLGSKDQLPFWLWANQLGRYDINNSATQHLGLNGTKEWKLGASGFSAETGVNLDLLLAEKNAIRFTQLYGGLSWKFLQAKFGAFADDEIYAGLSTSNGNLASSRNARPHPKIRIGFNRFVPVFVDWFAINGFYEEGLLNDDRYVENTHLHRKAFYFRIGTPSTFQFTGGMEHFVMWGGTHPKYGELQGIEAYWDYIKGSAGDSNSLKSDQYNVMGNGYGTYQIELQKNWKNIDVCFYISHPYDDKSGIELSNLEDNLYGLYFKIKKEKPILEHLVLEYIYTKNQSGVYHLCLMDDGQLHGRGKDDYYNHGVYNSGATYHQMAMVTPLFGPVILEEGISKGFDNTLLSGIHIGAQGYLAPMFHWQTKITYTNNFGKYIGQEGETYYSPSRKQASALAQIEWNAKKLPLSLCFSVAVDHGSLYDEGVSTTRPGTALSISYKLY